MKRSMQKHDSQRILLD